MDGGGRGRGRGRGGTPLAGIAEIDAQLGSNKGGPRPPMKGRGGRGGPKGSDFRGKPGLFTKGDWNCPQCNNINWERRTKCNICQFDKPGHLTSDEMRTGIGGGFNERQNRASGLSVEVDEEGYDDFGRRKKKAAADRKAKEAAALARLNASFGLGNSVNNGSDSNGISSPQKQERSRSRSRSRKKKDSSKSKSKSRKDRSRSRSRSRRRSKSRQRR